MCLCMIAERSLKCVSSAESTSKHNSILMKFDYLGFKDFFIVTPSVELSDLFLSHAHVYMHVFMYQFSLSKDIENNVIIASLKSE